MIYANFTSEDAGLICRLVEAPMGVLRSALFSSGITPGNIRKNRSDMIALFMRTLSAPSRERFGFQGTAELAKAKSECRLATLLAQNLCDHGLAEYAWFNLEKPAAVAG